MRLLIDRPAHAAPSRKASHAAIHGQATIGQQHADIHGARLTGGGFGGAVVLIARAGRGRRAAEEIRDDYRRRTGRRGVVLVPRQ